MTSAADNAAAAARRRAKKRETSPVTPLSLARLAAVQALYQIDLMKAEPASVIKEFCAFHLGPIVPPEDGAVVDQPDEEAPDMQDADQEHFRVIVEAVSDQAKAVDGLIRAHLVDGWTLERLDANMRALLRAACGAWVARPDLPAKDVLVDYLDIADAFFDGADLKFAGGVLNELYRKVTSNRLD
ncbi:MAG: transcription antitermination protein NusB [Alphaproteobacteria bacterium]